MRGLTADRLPAPLGPGALRRLSPVPGQLSLSGGSAARHTGPGVTHRGRKIGYAVNQIAEMKVPRLPVAMEWRADVRCGLPQGKLC